jgi:beta-glucosidase
MGENIMKRSKRKKLLKKLTAGVVTSTMVATTCAAAFVSTYDTAYAATTSSTESQREKKNANLSMNAATEGMVLLQNQNNALPIASKGKIALFGGGAYNTIKGGTGSGDVNQRYKVSVWDGFKNAGYDITSSGWLEKYKEKWDEGNSSYNGSMFGPPYQLADYELTDDDISAASGADTAIYVISRSSGEGSDRTATKGDYYLTDEEYANIKKMAESFKNSIVLLNTGGVMDTKFIKEIPELDSVLLMSQGGMEGGTAAVKVLNGEVNPSGKLTDTWAENYSDYPSSATFSSNDGDSTKEEYKDGIYVGYRYFDSFNKKPAYEFGYGLSYTSFDMKVASVEADEKKVTVKVNVKNTRNYAGKEVAEVYFSAPTGKLDKPYQELAGYGKTDLLAPGESETLTISYDTSEMSSYSEDDAAYIMEKGNYIVRVGNSSRNTHVAAVLSLDSTVTTEQISNQLKIDKSMDSLSDEGTTPYSYAEESNEIANAPKIQLSSNALDLIDGNNASKYDNQAVTTYVASDANNNETTTSSAVNTDYTETKETVDVKKDATLYDVYNKNITMEQFVAGLSNEKLANIVEGIGMGGSAAPIVGAQANSVNGAAGETTGKYYESDGIPNTVLSDGPAGIRITQSYAGDDGQTYYQYATAWPIGSLLAQTWDPDLVERVGNAIGEEMTEFGVTLWLAPGMNIHRNPLCGRNFEYYSEDPFITGTIGAAATKGVQSNPGIGVTVKHFATNNQENNRSGENNTVSERALREVYLKGFEMAVKSAQPMAIMSSYNKINGNWSGSNYDLLTDIARGEWNFNGLVMTDWFSGANPAESMHDGNDMIMPGGSQDTILSALEELAPTFGEDGYVTTTTKLYQDESGFHFGRIEQWNDFTPSVDGTATVSTTVKAGTALNDKIKDMVADCEATVSIESTNSDVASEIDQSVTTGSAVTENIDETSSDTIDETISDITGETTSTTTDAAVETDSDIMTDTTYDRIVTYKGSYQNNNTIYLGDLQKSAMRVLNMIMQSTQFAKMNVDKGVTAKPYEEEFDDLKNYLTLTKDDAVYSSSSSHHNSSSSSSGSSSNSNSSQTNSNNSTTNANNENSWKKNTDGTWSLVNLNGEKATGWVQDGSNWYHLDSSGIMQTGWLQDNDGSWYYLSENGAMKTGWLKDTDGKWYYLNDNGSMRTGWLKDTDGKWYYLNANGEMAVNTIIDGYEVDNTGAWIS